MSLQIDAEIEEWWSVWSCISTYRNTVCFLHPHCALSLQSGPLLTFVCLVWMSYLLHTRKEKRGKCWFLHGFSGLCIQNGSYNAYTQSDKNRNSFLHQCWPVSSNGLHSEPSAGVSRGRQECLESESSRPCTNGMDAFCTNCTSSWKETTLSRNNGLALSWCICSLQSKQPLLPLAWSQAHQKAWVTLYRTCRIAYVVVVSVQMYPNELVYINPTNHLP